MNPRHLISLPPEAHRLVHGEPRRAAEIYATDWSAEAQRARQQAAEEQRLAAAYRAQHERWLSIARGLKGVGCYPNATMEGLLFRLKMSQSETDKQAAKLAEIGRLQAELERDRFNVWSVLGLTPVLVLPVLLVRAVVNALLSAVGLGPVLDWGTTLIAAVVIPAALVLGLGSS